MAQLRQDHRKFVDRQAEVIAVGPEGPKEFTDFWVAERMPFTGIPDPEHIVSKLFGQKVNLFKLGRMPAQVVIDKQGRIRYHHLGESMSDIPLNEDILSLLDELNKEPAQQ
jgi:peroxiredoxin